LIYLDTSVALAHLLSEDRVPPDTLWGSPLVSSRLLEYELWVRLHARSLTRTHGDLARELLSRIAFVEMTPLVLQRALEPFPVNVRTLDALHLATADFLRAHGQRVVIASYDERLSAAGLAFGFELADL